MAPPPLAIHLFGPLRVNVRGEPLPRVRTRSVGWLLALLTLRHGRAVNRSWLSGTLWPESSESQGLQNLRHDLMRLRKALGPEWERIQSPARDLLTFDLTGAEVDVVRFDAGIQAGDEASLREAVGLYTGPLLEGCVEEWVLVEREARAEQCLVALETLAERAEGRGDCREAVRDLRRAQAMDPLRDSMNRRLMRILAASGDAPAALLAYREYRDRLHREMSGEPDVETTRLFQEIRARARENADGATRGRGRNVTTGRPNEGVRAEVARPTSLRSVCAPSRSLAPSPAGAPIEIAGKLPVQWTRFYGRQEEIARLTELLSASVPRLLTVTGPGGSGKTRLAVAAVERMVGAPLDIAAFQKAVVFVPLADVTDAARIPEAIADALGMNRSPQVEVVEQVASQFAAQPWLLVLDNYEHLVDEGALWVRTLLERAPTLTCLVTSRQRLGITGEQEFALLPLPTPRRETPLEQLGEYASVQLFVDRARAVRDDFALTAENAASVAELCDRLDGLPLALELAAARIAVLSPTEMLGQLKRRFAFLVSRQRDTPARHRTLLAVIESSYQLLDKELQRFFAWLSVFRGGWTLEAAEAVCDAGEERHPSAASPALGVPRVPDRDSGQRRGPGPGEALDYLEQLRDCSLLTVEVAEGEGRYRLLETLREYAWEQLAASGEQPEIQRRHWEWYLQLGERGEAAADLPEQREWLLRLERDLDNCRAALRACHDAADRRGDRAAAEAGLRLANALYWLWYPRGYLAEGLDAIETALADGSDLPSAVRTRALERAAEMAGARGDAPRAVAFREQSRHAHETTLQVARSEGRRLEIANTLVSLVNICFWLGDLDATWRYGLEARQLTEELEDAVGLARILLAMGRVALARGDVATARPLLEDRLAICRRLGTATLLIHALGGMGHLERDEGNYARARAFYQESMVLRQELGDKFALAQSLEDLAVLAGKQGQAERAIRLLGAEEAFCETLGTSPPVASAEYYSTVEESRAALGEARFAAVWAEGRALPLAQAIDDALS